ncbi:hypothetical protein QL285_008617 [Trifolium repens]|nr:hypothetical protein QL285_008617 [Trifolium repens]
MFQGWKSGDSGLQQNSRIEPNRISWNLAVLSTKFEDNFGPVRPPSNTSTSSTAVPYLDKTDFRRLQNGRLLSTTCYKHVIGLRCEGNKRTTIYYELARD